MSTKKQPALVVEIKENKDTSFINYTIQIIHQRCRGNRFAKDFHRFIASNGFRLVSDGSIEVTETNNGYDSTDQANRLFVRGSLSERDNVIVTAYTISFVEQLREAIKEYNEFMERSTLSGVRYE